MRRRKIPRLVASSLFCTTVFVFGISANDLNTGGEVGVLRTLSANTLGKTGFNTGLAFKYATGDDYVKGPGGTGPVVLASTGAAVSSDPAQLMSGNVFGAWGVTNNWDIALDLPVYEDITGWGKTSNGLGDLELSTKVRYPYQMRHAWISHSYYLNVIFPTGRKTEGFFPRHSYYIKSDAANSGLNAFSVDAMFFNPMLVWTFDFNRLRLSQPFLFHVNFGGVIAKAKSGSAVVAALALEYNATHSLTLFTELTGESRVKYYTESFSLASFDNDPFRLSPGMKIKLPRGLYCIVSGDIGFSDGRPPYRANWTRGGYRYSTSAIPKWSGQINLGWTGAAREFDSDGDGIVDRLDKCPDTPEDKDGYRDDDGCPDPDNDGDGIPDEWDQCPNQKARCTGCPETDADKDGIPDSADKCPLMPEDIDGFQDDDGCPDYDNDGDGIPDVRDKCPMQAEDFDGFEDGDGCPDYDNDKDGVPDSIDACSMVAGLPELNGCPRPAPPPEKKPEEIQRGPLILREVNFETGRAVLMQSSFAALDRVAESLRDWPEVKLEIQGHTDSRGSAVNNLRLSQARAEAVRLYLVQKGIAPERLTAAGYGKSKPIASNITAEGRKLNRRVELHRID